jgi:hypothetical protein
MSRCYGNPKKQQYDDVIDNILSYSSSRNDSSGACLSLSERTQIIKCVSSTVHRSRFDPRKVGDYCVNARSNVRY